MNPVKFIAALLFLILSISCTAQKSSRIVFLRMNATLDKKSPSIKEDGRSRRDHLQKNNRTLSDIGGASVFIYNTDSLHGSYFLVADTSVSFSKKVHYNTITLPDAENTITFIKISLIHGVHNQSKSTIISPQEFEQCYNSTKWLRKGLKKLGYSSVEELTKGYGVLPDSTINEFNRNRRRWKPGDTTYLNDDDIKCGIQNAVRYITYEKDSAGIAISKVYSYPRDIFYGKRFTYLSNTDNERTHVVKFFENGNIKCQGDYYNNRPQGRWEYYYDTGSHALWYECVYEKGLIEGTLKCYYKNGKIRVEEVHDAGSRKNLDMNTHNTDNPYSAYGIISGHSFDTEGNPIKYTPFFKKAVTSYNHIEYLHTNTQYPEKARKLEIQGEVIVHFFIDKNGKVKDPIIGRGVFDDLDEEALRVVRTMPDWIPGSIDGVPTGMYFKVPINFSLAH